MYKRHDGQILLFERPVFFGCIPLNPDNDKVKLAAILPWNQIEECYTASLSGSAVGQPAVSSGITVGA